MSAEIIVSGTQALFHALYYYGGLQKIFKIKADFDVFA
jgi:hypothetical protein